jgi:cytochrome c-type biogenesis protein CcmH
VERLSTRRHFLQTMGVVGAAMVVSPLHAQETAPATMANMDQNAYVPVKLPPKAGVAATVTVEQRDAMEHQLHCQCGCGHDVYTCRNTDFNCSVAPAMHADVISLITGGYSVPEIVKAFHDVYGDRVLMAPPKEGFNLLAYILPFAAIAVGGSVAMMLLKRWTSRSASAPVAVSSSASSAVSATPDELARLERALRSDE